MYVAFYLSYILGIVCKGARWGTPPGPGVQTPCSPQGVRPQGPGGALISPKLGKMPSKYEKLGYFPLTKLLRRPSGDFLSVKGGSTRSMKRHLEEVHEIALKVDKE